MAQAEGDFRSTPSDILRLFGAWGQVLREHGVKSQYVGSIGECSAYSKPRCLPLKGAGRMSHV